jgi:superfamily II DNA or RNA helicase
MPLSSCRKSLAAAIQEAHAQLVDLDARRAETAKRLEQLKVELAALAESPPLPCLDTRTSAAPLSIATPATSAEKVALFRRLFRGRDDVFPVRWVNRKTGRGGYSPSCANEWQRGICEKPRITCSECPQQAFAPVTDAALLDHLQGRHVMGVYPLLHDETCWFLAVDFDGDAWTDHVHTFVETCRVHGVEPAVERSRSGHGGHTWFFFASAVQASVARQFASYLLTQTMDRRPDLGMQSYDRLFPNQDTMPRGGFGNLIALPLQHDARALGNTVFVDDESQPHENQWAYLAARLLLSPDLVDRLAREAVQTGQVLGVRWEGIDDEEDAHAPWTRRPSGTRPIALTGPLPPEVRAVLAQRLYVEKATLPPALVNRIARLAAFQNPEFYKKQRLRLYTGTTPRVITCAEQHPQHVSLPRGCLADLEELLSNLGIRLSLEDQRTPGASLNLRFAGQLTDLQGEAFRAALAHDDGVIVAPPGSGKTVLGAAILAARGRNTLVLVHRQPLLDQWIARLAAFLELDPKAIGQIRGGKRAPNGRLDVAMLQSLVHDGRVDDLVATYGHVIVDECHHVPAVTFERVLSEVRAQFVLGLTATATRRDGHHPILHMQLGPVRFGVDARARAARAPFVQRVVLRHTAFAGGGLEPDAGIQELYAALARDEVRNQLILNDVIAVLAEGRSPILLTERTDQLEYFAERLAGFTPHLIVLRGGMSARRRRQAQDTLAAIPEDQERLVLATGRYIGEGFDDARLDTLFLALPISWRGTLVQYAGRLQRQHSGKTEVRVVDYVDGQVPMLRRMFEKRLRGYQALGYEVDVPDAAGRARRRREPKGRHDIALVDAAAAGVLSCSW